VSAPAPWAARMSEPAPATAELGDRGGEGLAKAGIVLGMAALPILRPSFLRNLAPADLGIVLGIGLVLLWAGSTRQRLRLPFAAGVGLMVVAGTLSALFGELPWLGAVTMVQDLYLLAWAAVVANFGRTASGAGFLVNTWCVSAAVWAVGLLAVFGPSAVANLDSNRAGFTDAGGGGDRQSAACSWPCS
jgi:hypothetical protein